MAEENTKYKLKSVEFLGVCKRIVLQKSGISCPLVTVTNFIILNEGPLNHPKYKLFWSGTGGEGYVRHKFLQEFVSKIMEIRLKLALSLNAIQANAADACKNLCKIAISGLSTRSSLHPLSTSIESFEYSDENCLFDILGAMAYHGYLIDPEDASGEVVATKTNSEAEGNVHQMSLVEKIPSSVSHFTSYGLGHLKNGVPEGQLSLLFINDNISVLYKHEQLLHILVEEEIENHQDAMWRMLENVTGDGQLLTSIFVPIKDWLKAVEMLVEEEKEEKAEANKMKKKRQHKKRDKKSKPEQGGNVIENADPGNSNRAEEEVTCTTQYDLKGRFMDFLKEFRLPGCKIPYFTGQVMAMVHVQSFDLEFSYDKIMDYDEVLAKAICNNYYRAAEELRLSLCDYIYSVIQAEARISSAVTQEELYKRTKLNICCRPERNRIFSFEEFIKENVMYSVYHFEQDMLNSTSYVGRMLAMGYLRCILRVLKSKYSWNGSFEKSDMSVTILKGVMTFDIRRTAKMVNIRREYAINDFNKYKDIVFPLFMRDDFKALPCFFDQFVVDYLAMPDPCKTEEFEKFLKYMDQHFFGKAPLVRSGAVCNAFKVCDSLIFDKPYVRGQTAYGPLNVFSTKLPDLSRPAMSEPLRKVFNYWDNSTGANQFPGRNYWFLLLLGRHGTVHMTDHTKDGNNQKILDLIIVDLILERDLKGSLAAVFKYIMEINNFDGQFSSTWRTLVASECYDEPGVNAAIDEGKDAPDIFSKENEGKDIGATVASVRPDASQISVSGVGTTAVLHASAPVNLEGEVQDNEFKVSAEELGCLAEGQFLFDGVMCYVYRELSKEFSLFYDLKLIDPSVSHALGNVENPMGKVETAKEVLQLVEPLDIDMRRLVLMPVNDNRRNDDGDGGRHWSLLVIYIAKDRQSCKIVHHDSVPGFNKSSANRFADRLRPFLPQTGPVVEGFTPKQLNGFDCGLYVLVVCKVICNWWRTSGHDDKSDCWFEAVRSQVTAAVVKKARVQLRNKLTGQNN